MKPITIVGGGWFGCHIAASLLKRGIEFTLVEQADRLFAGASGHNQNRLHLGFHYPRSAITRRQSYEGYYKFREAYPSLSRHLGVNAYAVANDSLMDFESYVSVMGRQHAFQLTDPAMLQLANVEGCVLTEERMIRTDEARQCFTKLLQNHVQFNTRLEAAPAGTLINCTYQAPGRQYEPCLVLVYQTTLHRAITIVDGPFYSIYPAGVGVSTLYGVQESRLGTWPTHAHAQNRLAVVNEDEVRRKRWDMEAGVSKYCPAFQELYTYTGWYGSIRCLEKNQADARVCHVRQQGDVIHVLSGKIDSIFYAEQEVLKCLGCL